MNHEGIQIYREAAAHSDSDSIVLFRGSDVVVTGDIIDANRFPVIDIARGGNIQGEIEALNQVIDLSFRPMPFVFAEGGTYVVPGHGRIYDRQDVVEYRDMVVTIRDIIQDMIQRGMTLPQIKEASPAKAYEREYGAKSGRGPRTISLKPCTRADGEKVERHETILAKTGTAYLFPPHPWGRRTSCRRETSWLSRFQACTAVLLAGLFVAAIPARPAWRAWRSPASGSSRCALI
jgi:hypothetical protein